jgi:serine/threonine protein kinase
MPSVHIPGYELTELLYQSGRSVIYRGRRHGNGLPVVAKCLRAPASHADRGFLRYAFDVLQSLDIEGVARVLDLADVDGEPALVMHDSGGSSLDQMLQLKPLPVADVLHRRTADDASVAARNDVRVIGDRLGSGV